MRRTMLLGVAVLICAFSLQAGAVVVFSQPADELSPGTAYLADMGSVSFPTGISADDFVLAGPYDILINNVSWWGFSYSNLSDVFQDNFTIEFYTDNAGPVPPPFATFAAGEPAHAVTDGIGWVNRYSFDLPQPLRLQPGVTYHIAIYNNTPDGDWGWYAAVPQSGNGLFYWQPDLQSPFMLYQVGDDLSFELAGDPVPEPISATLFIGSVCFGLARLRRRRS